MEGFNYCSASCWSFCEQFDTNSVQHEDKMIEDNERVTCELCGCHVKAIQSYLDFDSGKRYCSATCLHDKELTMSVKEAHKRYETAKASDKQEGGSHYKNYEIEPIDFVHANNLSYIQGNVIKYIVRYKDKNGLEDLKKAKHYIDLLIEREYSEDKNVFI